MMKSGATFRIVVSDFAHDVRQYCDDPSPGAAHNFMKASRLGRARRADSLTGILSDWLGNSQHLWMWDYTALERALLDEGFVDVRRAAFGDAEDPAFDAVEDEGRWIDCLGVECRRS